MIYNEEFINFVHEIFPSISPYVADQVKSSIDQFHRTGAEVKYFTSSTLNDLSQGDIVENLRFISVDEKGMLQKMDTLGMIISNTCDIENDDSIVIAPLIPINEIELSSSGLENLKRNRIYRFIYIPEGILTDYVIDLGRVTTFNKVYLIDQIDSGNFIKKSSLNQLGYYFFLCKVAVHFLRPEDTTIQGQRFSMVV